MLMAKGKMGERVSEDAQLKLTDLVVDYGYKAGNTQKTRVVHQACHRPKQHRPCRILVR